VNKGRILAFAIALSVVTGTVAFATQPTVCQPITPLFSVAEAISDQDHPCREWVYKLQGRVTKNSHMSASVWSLRTEAGTALIVSAIHTLLFILYNPEVPPEQSGNYLRDILPRHDFFVGVIDSQKVVMDPFPGEPAPLKHEPPVIFDPSDLTTVAPTAADVTPGDSVLLMGYPRAGELAGVLAASIGRVLNDTEAEATIEELAALGDEEGGIAYDPEAEMVIEGNSVVGMSGGGVYDRAGSLVGILVRASNEYDGKQYVRAVRMTFVVARINSAYEALSDSERADVSPYLEPMPMPAPTPMPTPTPTPPPSPPPEPGGIPGFPVESLLAGLAVVIIVLWFRQRTS